MQGKISLYTIIKLVFLIVFSIFQILLLNSIFGNKISDKLSIQGSGYNSGNDKIYL